MKSTLTGCNLRKSEHENYKKNLLLVIYYATPVTET